MAYLKDLGQSQKIEMCLVRILEAKSYEDLAGYIDSNWGFKITRQSIGNFFRSEEGTRIMDQAYTQLKAEYADEPLVEKSTRVLSLRDQALKIKALLATLPVSDEFWIGDSQEFRQYIKQISVEMEGLQITVADGRSPIEMALEQALKVKLAGD